MQQPTLALALRARDLMQTDLLTVSPETPLLDIHRMFVEAEIHGAPVIDEDGYVRGVVSTLDLVRALRDESDAGGYPGLEAQLAELRAGDVMTREVVAVTPDTPIADVAQTMRVQRIHRVLVIEDRVLVGVVTSFDLLRAFIAVPEEAARVA